MLEKIRNQVWYMAVVLGLVGGVAGWALSAVASATEPIIEKRMLEQKIKPSLQKFFGALQPDNDPIADRVTLDLGIDNRGRKMRLTVFPARKDGQLIGAALRTKGGGYGGDIEVLTVFDVKASKILGVKTISQSETKGLGARVSDDNEPFIKQFSGMGYANGVKLRANNGQVDAISGATFSSTGFTAAVNDAARLLGEHKAAIGGGKQDR